MVTRADIEAEAAYIMALILRAREQGMVTVVHSPKNTIRIDTIWAFVSVDPEDNTEGVIAGPLMGPGSIVPFIAADEARLASLRPLAQKLAKQLGRPVRLLKFSVREVIEDYE
jgi:hypothetical protein